MAWAQVTRGSRTLPILGMDVLLMIPIMGVGFKDSALREQRVLRPSGGIYD